MRPLLDVSLVSKSFRGLRAVNRVSLEVHEREIVALIGPNGAGKTTFFNLVSGVLAPEGGHIRFAGQRIDGLRPHRVCAAGIGRTFQIVRPFAGLTVLDNVVVGALLRERTLPAARARAEQMLQLLGLASKRDLPASTLTLPERKRLELARALATRPVLLLLDEVMAGLRPLECDQLVLVLRELQAREGFAVLLIEHVLRAVHALAERVYVLHHGELIASGDPTAVLTDPAVVSSYLGLAQTETASAP
jgi:branched-chain amino acid transport system ATP-binding protein